MPYADPEKRRAYQREWMRRWRADDTSPYRASHNRYYQQHRHWMETDPVYRKRFLARSRASTRKYQCKIREE